MKYKLLALVLLSLALAGCIVAPYGGDRGGGDNGRGDHGPHGDWNR